MSPPANFLGITSPDGLQTRWDYNAYGQVVHVADREGQANESNTTQWGGSVPLLTLVHTTRYRYAEPQSETPNTVEDAKGGQKHLTWSVTGLLTSYTDCSGSTTRYRYNRWGQRIETTGEEARAATAGTTTKPPPLPTPMRWAKPPPIPTTRADLIGVTAADGVSVEFERDAQGQLLTYQYGNPAQPLIQRFQYDAAGRLATHQRKRRPHHLRVRPHGPARQPGQLRRSRARLALQRGRRNNTKP